jgi:hypothetical protein
VNALKFRKKPVVIEAVQFTPENVDLLTEWLPFQLVMTEDNGLHIPTLEGEMTGSVGDWIIKGVQGEFYPCKPDIFEATYEPADGAS